MRHFWIFGWLVQLHWAKRWGDRVTITNQEGYETRIFVGLMYTEPKEAYMTPIYRLVLWRLMIEVGSTTVKASNKRAEITIEKEESFLT